MAARRKTMKNTEIRLQGPHFNEMFKMTYYMHKTKKRDINISFTKYLQTFRTIKRHQAL